MTLVFTYGTLRKGHGNWRNFLDGKSRYIGTFRTKTNMLMTERGFPFVWHPTVNGLPSGVTLDKDILFPVVGDLFEVEDSATVSRMDSLEGHPHWYRRDLVQLNGFDQAVWMYLQRSEVSGQRSPVAPFDGVDCYHWGRSLS